ESYEFLQTKCGVRFGRDRPVSGANSRGLKNAIKECRLFGRELDETIANRGGFARNVYGGANLPQYERAARPKLVRLHCLKCLDVTRHRNRHLLEHLCLGDYSYSPGHYSSIGHGEAARGDL